MSKRMTKVLSLILTLVMFLSVSTPAFAWGNIGIGNGWDRDIGEDEIRDFNPDAEPEENEEYDFFSNFDEETGINVVVEAPMGALPLDAEVRVEPVDTESVRDAVDGLVEGEHQILVAMDISFWLDDVEIEPEEPVRVRIAAPELEGRTDLTVVHIPDEDEPETMELITDEDELKFELATNEVCFESGDFSVYAVIGGSANALKLTVEFYESATATTPLSTQVLVLEQFDEEGEAPLIDPGVPTITATQSFEGWRIDAEHENLDVNGLNEYIHTTYGTMTADATLRVNAMIFNVRYVIYHDQSGAVLRTQSFHVEEGGTASVMISHPYVAFQGGQNFTAWTSGDYVDVMGDYPLYKDGVESHLYRNDTAYNLSDTLQLYPYVQTGDWLIFDNNLGQDGDNTSASYTSPVFVPAGENTVAPATPTRTGYTFDGWYKEKTMTNRFIFGSPIGQETTVYAKWTPKTTTYQVIFWQQNSTDAVDAEDSEKTYSFYKSDERTATTGQSVSLNLSDSGTTADNRLGGNSESSIGEMGFYFEYNEANSTTTSVTVKGDGSTVLNVYYDRKVITFNFYGDLTRYTYSNSTYSSNYPYYGVDSDGYLIRVHRSGGNWGNWYDSSNNLYNGYVYHLTFSTSSSPTSSNRFQYGSIQGLWFSTLDNFDWDANTTISGSDWPFCGDYLMWHNEKTGRYTGKMFQFETGTDLTTTTVNYYLNEYERSSTVRYYTALGQDSEGNYTIEIDKDSMKSGETLYLSGDEYYGYRLSRYSMSSNNYNNATVWNGNELAVSYSNITGSNGAYFFYARNKWDFVYESNSSQVKTESRYWEADLSDLASYVPTNGPAGCYFDGWYADPGFSTPFDFTQEMPNHAVMVYAKWTVTRYRVVLDPTGGEAGVDATIVTFPGNQVTTFRVDYGEKVEGSSINNAERPGYTLLGWYLDKEFTQPYNFANPVTDEVADMSYATASASERQGVDPWNIDSDTQQPKTYNDADGEHDDVRGKVTIYAHWRKDPNGIIGINVRYDAVESTEHEGYFGTDQTNTIWNDPDIYADQAQAYAQPASTPKVYDPALKFLYWDILTPDPNDSTKLISSGRKAYPGMTFQIEFDDAVQEAISNNVAPEPELYTFERGNVKLVRPGQAGLMAETMTVYAPVDTIETGVDYLIGVKASDGKTYLLMSYNPSTGTYYGSASVSGYTADHLSYAIPAVVDENGYVTGVDSSNISGATLAHVEWIFSEGRQSGMYRIQSGYNNSYYLRIGTDSSSSSDNLNMYPASGYSSSYGGSWVWENNTLSHNYGGSFLRKYIAVLSTNNIPTYFDADSDSSYARTIQLYKKTTIEVGPTMYTVTFMDGYTNTKIADVQVEEGTAATAPNAPDHSAQGMIFNGWNTAFDNVTSDITVTAQYVSQSSLSYTVTFRYMLPDGTWTSTSQTVNHGTAATPPFTKDTITEAQMVPGYEFNSWDRRYDSITSNITINAVYKQVATTKYVITLRAVYGRADAGSVTHINWYSNTYDGYGNPIPGASTETTYVPAATLFPNGIAEKSGSGATYAYENNGAYGEHGFNLVYDNVEIPESVLIPEKPYDIPGYTFKGWARIPTTEDIADFDLNDDELYIKWVEDNSATGAGHYEARYDGNKLSQNYYLYGWINGQDVDWEIDDYKFNTNGTLTVTFPSDTYVFLEGGTNHYWYRVRGTHQPGATGAEFYSDGEEKLFVPGNTEVTFTLTEREDGSLFLSYAEGAPAEQGEVWVPVTYVAANEQKPYHDMYAVWEGSFTIYHSGLPGGGLDGEPVKVPINRKLTNGFDLTATVTELNNANRDGEDKYLYGGYYIVKEGSNFAPPVAVDGVIPAYDGTNWTWVNAETESGMAITPVAGQTYYIKEVPADKYLQPYFHYTYNKGTGEIHTGWLISAIDDETYTQTGFMVTANGQARVCQSLTVEAKDSSYNVKLTAKRVFGSAGLLTYRRVINHYVGEEDVGFANDVKIQQYWVTPDGIIVTGTGYRIYTGIEKTDTVQGETKFEASTLTDSAKTEFESLEQQPKDEN